MRYTCKYGRRHQGFSYLSDVGARGLLNLGKYHLSHQNWENQIQSKNTRSPFEIDRFKTIINISVIALTFIIAQKYMHQCVNVNICNFAIFGPIFMKFSSNCIELRDWECYSLFWEVFAHFLDKEGTDIRPQIRPRKISGHWFRFSKKCISKVSRSI